MMPPGPHDVLGLDGDASAEQVRDAHRRLVRALHPDAGGSRALFEQVQLAYEQLQGEQVAPVAEPAPEQPVAAPDRQPLLARAVVVLRGELRAKPREQWVVESLLAAQLSIGGVGVLSVLLR